VKQNLPDLIEQLQKQLKAPLPGETGQRLMSPLVLEEDRFNRSLYKSARKGAVLILMFEENGQWYFPLIRRPVYSGVHSGQISLPGGKMDPSDPDLAYTALRENQEELGVDPAIPILIGKLSELFIPVSNFLVLPYVAYLPEVIRFSPDPIEVEQVLKAPLNLLKESKFRKKTSLKTTKGSLVVPYFDLDGEIVWGATAMILAELSTILSEIF
jgi:8-oxo-dGTP pyrophosphatase MutT (NUDIX family)